ncbi:MAG: four helix bundle protein [Polyangiaceae bacterium]
MAPASALASAPALAPALASAPVEGTAATAVAVAVAAAVAAAREVACAWPFGAPSAPPPIFAEVYAPAVARKLRRGMVMHTPLRDQLLTQIMSILAQARPLVDIIARRDRELASQARRALSSIALNAAEGFGTQAGNARLRFQSAHGSLSEARVALELAVVWGYLDESKTADLLAALHAVGGRLYGLARR